MTSRQDITMASPVKQFRPLDDGMYASLSGEIDLENAAELRRALLDMADENKPAKLVLDLREVPYMDSSALAVLVETLRKVRSWNGKLVLLGLQKRVRGLIEISRLNTILPVVESEAAAIKF